MKKFFGLFILVIFCIIVCKIYLGNRDIRNGVDKAAVAARSGAKTILKKSSDAL